MTMVERVRVWILGWALFLPSEYHAHPVVPRMEFWESLVYHGVMDIHPSGRRPWWSVVYDCIIVAFPFYA